MVRFGAQYGYSQKKRNKKNHDFSGVFEDENETEEQRYLILECKVRIFEDVVHKDDEFAHDGSKRSFGGFACGAQPLIKRFELAVGT